MATKIGIECHSYHLEMMPLAVERPKWLSSQFFLKVQSEV